MIKSIGENIKLSTKSDYSLTGLKDALNKEYGGKFVGSGENKKFTHKFNLQDIQQYVNKEKIPEKYGGFYLTKIENGQLDLKVYRLTKNKPSKEQLKKWGVKLPNKEV